MTKKNDSNAVGEVLENASVKFIKEYHVNPLEKRLADLEKRLSPESVSEYCKKIFREQLGGDIFRNRFNSLFNEGLKVEGFITKVSSIVKKEIGSERKDVIVKIILYIVGGFVLALLGGFAQKFLKIF